MDKTMKALAFILTFCIIAGFSQATLIATKHQANESLKLNKTQLQKKFGVCIFWVIIKTSCLSPSPTRDQISLKFGDADGTQIDVPRLDDPSSGIFEKCSTNKFELNGPCTQPICYVLLYRIGDDGWIPDTVTVYASNLDGPVTVYVNINFPPGLWYGSNFCEDVWYYYDNYLCNNIIITSKNTDRP